MTLCINDLPKNLELDNRALASVRGGFAYKPGYFGPKPGPMGHGPAVILPGNFFHKSLTNVSNQLNIVVNSQNVSQSNSNTVIQY